MTPVDNSDGRLHSEQQLLQTLASEEDAGAANAAQDANHKGALEQVKQMSFNLKGHIVSYYCSYYVKLDKIIKAKIQL